MKKMIFMTIFALLFTTSAYSASKMSGVSQDINIDNAKITTSAGGAGGSIRTPWGGGGGSATYGGTVNIGEIENEGTMENVSQNISAQNAEITTQGADVNIGRIKNK